jgi:arylsulfatase A-like enzyme/Flp pilus assembly protein TadD
VARKPARTTTIPAVPATRRRRTTAALIGTFVGGLLIAGAWLAWRSDSPLVADGPIVLISIDTLRADRLPAYGYARAKTPELDELASDGVLFEQAYSHSPQTLPSHTSILTGRLPFEHGVRDNIGFSARKDERFLQHTLGERGFATAGFVSAFVLRAETGIGAGFDTFDDELRAASPDAPLGQVQRPGAETAEAASRWLDAQGSGRCFLFVHIYEPHTPYSPPARFAAANPYDGEVQYSDEIVGQLIGSLRRKGLYDSATIVLLSDHGEGLGDHGEDEHGIFLYRETIRVPLIVKLPGSRSAGTRVSTPVQLIDVAPTILDLVGAPPTRGLRGRSLRAVLDGSGPLPPASIYSEALTPRYHFGWSELYALTDERYRLIRAPRDELYDLAQDPGERQSIADGRPQVRAAMRQALDSLIANVQVEAPSAVSDADRQKLAALGYIAGQSGGTFETPGDRLPNPKDKLPVLQQYRRAVDRAGDRRFEEATALFRELLREEPGMTDVWLQLAYVYGRRGMIAEAVEAYKRVIERNPKDAASLTGAATGLLRLGKLDEARAHAELAVGVAPPAAHELLARIAVERGDPDTARREALKAREADPTLPMPAFIDGLILYRGGKYAEALPRFLEARAALERRTIPIAEVDFHIADSLARLERYAEAEPYFAAEIGRSPGNSRARAGLAMLYRAMGRTADSERAVAELVRSSPTREAYTMAAQLWTMFGEPERAAEARAQAKRIGG